MQARRSSFLPTIIILTAFLAIIALGYHWGASRGKPHAMPPATVSEAAPNTPAAEDSIDLTENQLKTFKIESAVTRSFRMQREAVGNVVYHENDMGDNAHTKSNSRFLVANIYESDGPALHEGEPVTARVMAYPGRVFHGTISTLGVTAYDSGGNPAVDPNTHRITARCEISDPDNALFPGMLASIVIDIQDPVESIAVPQNGVTREGDGTMTAWVTQDRRHFEKRIVKTGLRQDGFVQILSGIAPGDLVVTDNAVFMDNMNNADTQQ